MRPVQRATTSGQGVIEQSLGQHIAPRGNQAPAQYLQQHLQTTASQGLTQYFQSPSMPFNHFVRAFSERLSAFSSSDVPPFERDFLVESNQRLNPREILEREQLREDYREGYNLGAYLDMISSSSEDSEDLDQEKIEDGRREYTRLLQTELGRRWLSNISIDDCQEKGVRGIQRLVVLPHCGDILESRNNLRLLEDEKGHLPTSFSGDILSER